jgi:purine-binding chemotaxis protein CheW
MTELMNLAESLLDEDNALVLVCEFCGNTFGIPTSHIQEVLAVPEIRPVHHAAAYVKGLFNLRGRVLALIDPAVKLELQPQIIGPESRILVVETNSELVGFLVESLTGIFPFSDENLVPNPENLQPAMQQSLAGFFFLDGNMIGLLKLEQVLEKYDEGDLNQGEN